MTECLKMGPKLGRQTVLACLLLWPLSYLSLRRFARGLSSDALVVLSYKYEQLLWPKAYRHKVVILEHGPVPALLAHVHVFRRRLRGLYEGAGSLSAVSATAAASIGNLTERPVQVLPMAVTTQDVRLAISRRAEARTHLLPPASAAAKGLIVFAGRLAHNKRVDRVIDLLPLLGPEWHLVVAGDGPAGHQLREQARRHGVTQRVTFTGSLPDILPVIAAADVLVLPSEDPGEGRPLAALEAVACGTPVLAADRAVMAEMQCAAEIGHRRLQLTDFSDIGRAVSHLLALASGPRSPAPLSSWEAVARALLPSSQRFDTNRPID